MTVSTSISGLLKIPTIFWPFDFDGKSILYSSNETGHPQLHLLNVKRGSKPKLLTKGQEPVLDGLVLPNRNRLVYVQDRAGNEEFHVYVLRLDGGEPEQVTKNAYKMWGGWDTHPDGKEVTRSFASMKSCGLETINVETGECFILKEPTPPIGILKYSHDGKWIACDAMASAKSQQILVINRKNPSDTIVYSVKEDSRDIAPSWSPDDKKLAFTTDATGARQVAVQGFQNEERVFLELEQDEEVLGYRQPAWSSKGDKVYYIVSKHSRTTVHGHPIDGQREKALPFPQGTVEFLLLGRDGKMVALHSSMTSPRGIYLHEIGSKSAVPLTPRHYSFDLTKLAKPQSVWYKSFDGRRIHGWYLSAASRKPARPAVVYVHGGPWMQVFDNWTFDADFLHSFSQNGFAVFAPNFRGSTGYGAEFQKLDVGDLGGGDLEDVFYGAEWLRKQKDVDKSRLVVMGGSYGGYLTLMALTKKPEVFAAGVCLVPITDWLEAFELEDSAFRALDEALWGGSLSNKELYRDRSPITHVSKIKAPVMIMAGKEDARCPIKPIEKFVQKLEQMKHPHEFRLEEKAGHISTLFKWEEKIPLFDSIVEYLRKVLMDRR